MAEHRPRAGIDTPRVIELDWQRRQHLLHAARRIGIAGRGILHLVKLARKPPKS
jgi:hypothetical protein